MNPPVDIVASLGGDADGESYLLQHRSLSWYPGTVSKVVPDLLEIETGDLVSGQTATLTIRHATPAATVSLFASSLDRGATHLNSLDVRLGLAGPALVDVGQADMSGPLTLSLPIPNAVLDRDPWLQAAEPGNTSNVLSRRIESPEELEKRDGWTDRTCPGLRQAGDRQV